MTTADPHGPVATAAQIVLQLEDLTAYRGGRPVSRLSRLQIRGGEGALLIGPSGSGKTSLLLAIAGLAESSGRVVVNGLDISTLSAVERTRFRGRSIGFIFQDIHLMPGLSVEDNLLLAPFAAGQPQDRQRARRLLADLGLGLKADRPAQTLSRGEAQRAAIARAMLMRPSLILADEPTASLDDAACMVVADLLLDAAAQSGAALIIATHDRRLRARIQTHVIVEAAA